MRWGPSAEIDYGMLGIGYLTMITTCLPFSLVCRAFRWHRVWAYVVVGAVLGFVVPVYITFLVNFVLDGSLETQSFGIPPPFIPQLWHFQSGAALITVIMYVLFWAIAVRNNHWFQQRPNPPLNRTRADGARAG